MHERRAAALAQFLTADGNPWGQPWTPTLLREQHRPFSEVSWWRLEGPAGTREVVVKVVRGGDAERRASLIARDARDAAAFAEALPGDRALRVVQPLRAFPELGVTVTPAVGAPSLAQLVEGQAAWWHGSRGRLHVRAGCRLAGAWLRTAQRHLTRGGVRSPEQLRRAFTVRLERLVRLGARAGLRDAEAADILAWVDATIAVLSPSDVATTRTHGDFAPGNMLFDGEGLWVLDFTTAHENAVLLDVTRFCHQLSLLELKPFTSAAPAREWRHAFLDGYGRPELPGTPGFQLFMARHTLTHWSGRVRRRSVRWWSRAYDRYVCRHHRRVLLGLCAGSIRSL